MNDADLKAVMGQTPVMAVIAVVMLILHPQSGGKKLTQSEVTDARALVLIADKAMTGDYVGLDASLHYQGHFFRAPGGRTYVPFTIAIEDGSDGPFRSIAAYVRVARRGDRITSQKRDVRIGPMAFIDGASGGLAMLDRPDSPPAGPYPLQDLFFLPLPHTELEGERMIRRAVALPPGAYDFYFVIREPESSLRLGEMPKKAFLKLGLDVPDFSARVFAMSSIIVAERLIALERPLPPAEQAQRPYALGKLEIVPARRITFNQSNKLTVAFIVYNAAADRRGKPDVSVEYLFRRTGSDRTQSFSRTEPHALNANTLAPEFDLRAGHELMATRAVSLDAFPPGEYQLEVRVTDRLESATVSRDVSFAVR